MGCGDSRDELNSEEVVLIHAERSLLYHELNPTDIDFICRKYSKEGLINENQWKDIHKRLSTAISLPLPPQQVLDFYKNLQTDNKFFLREILVLGIILTGSDSQIKAKLIFEAFDENNEKILYKYDLSSLCSFLVELSVEKTYILISDPRVNKDEIGKFIQKLRDGKKKAKDELLKVCLGGNLEVESIKINKFIEILSIPSNSQLMTLQGIRKLVLRQESTDGKFSAFLRGRPRGLQNNYKIEESAQEKEIRVEKENSIIVSQFSDKTQIRYQEKSDIVSLDRAKYMHLLNGDLQARANESDATVQEEEKAGFQIYGDFGSVPSGKWPIFTKKNNEKVEKNEVQRKVEDTKTEKVIETHDSSTGSINSSPNKSMGNTKAKTVAHTRGLSIDVEECENERVEICEAIANSEIVEHAGMLKQDISNEVPITSSISSSVILENSAGEGKICEREYSILKEEEGKIETKQDDVSSGEENINLYQKIENEGEIKQVNDVEVEKTEDNAVTCSEANDNKHYGGEIEEEKIVFTVIECKDKNLIEEKFKEVEKDLDLTVCKVKEELKDNNIKTPILIGEKNTILPTFIEATIAEEKINIIASECIGGNEKEDESDIVAPQLIEENKKEEEKYDAFSINAERESHNDKQVNKEDDTISIKTIDNEPEIKESHLPAPVEEFKYTQSSPNEEEKLDPSEIAIHSQAVNNELTPSASNPLPAQKQKRNKKKRGGKKK